MNFFQQLLPERKNLELKSWHFEAAIGQLTLTVCSTQTEATCPLGQELTRRVHSRDERTLHDLPCVNFGMTLLLQVRKCFCINSAGKRRLFTERFPQVADPWARRTLTSNR